MNTISRDELREKLDRGDDFKLVMTLNQWAFDAKHIPGSINISNMEEIDSYLQPDEDIVVYCSDDACIASQAAYRILDQKGYTNIRRYSGGLSDWEDAGLPLEGTMTEEQEKHVSKLDDALRNLRGNEKEIRVPAVEAPCEHVAVLSSVVPSGDGCKECLDIGDTWLHLRLCMTCGHVGCCDGSKNKHATKHHHASGHPVVKSYEPGEHWLWCYVDEQLMY